MYELALILLVEHDLKHVHPLILYRLHLHLFLIIDWYVLKLRMKKALEKYIYETTKRRPTVLPIIMEV